MAEVPAELDAPRVRRAMLDLFPSYEPRFAAIDRMLQIMDACRLQPAPETLCPCLLLLSTEEHPVFASLAGGAPAEALYAPLFPRALVQRVHGSSHVTIPFSADCGHCVVQFIGSVAGTPSRHAALLQGRALFVDTQRAMEGARSSFRAAWQEKYGSVDFRRRRAATTASRGRARATACRAGEAVSVFEIEEEAKRAGVAGAMPLPGVDAAEWPLRGRGGSESLRRGAEAISLFEIEEVLRRHPSVAELVAFEEARRAKRPLESQRT